MSTEQPELAAIGVPRVLVEAPAADILARSRRRGLLSVGEACFVWVVLVLVIGWSNPLPTALAASLLFAAIWVFSVRSFRRSLAHLEVAGLFVVDVIAAAGATLVLTAAAAAWNLGGEQVAVVAMGALFAAAFWEYVGDAVAADERTVLLVGQRADGIGEVLHSLNTDRRARFVPVGVVVEDLAEPDFGPVPIVGQIADLGSVVRELSPDLVVVGVQRGRPEVFAELLEAAEAGFRVVGLPEFCEYAFGRLPVRRLTAAWFMSVIHLYQRPYSAASKRAFDIVAACLILILVLPLLPLVVVMVRMTPGGVIYRQTRIGENGRPFTILKFRTMSLDAEVHGAPIWATKEDPRVTQLGRILRLSRIDELPQLVNVLRGDMSIVGPRPERPEFVAMLESEIPFWSRRHLLKPGITGWAQVRSDYAADTLATEEKLAYDLWYLRHRSLMVDAVICILTLPRVLTGAGAR